jgi:ATP-binding cassette, subfamily B, bacterial
VSHKNISQASIKLAFKHYTGEIKRTWRTSLPGILLPGIGTIFITFVPTYLVAKLIGHIVAQPDLQLTTLLSYVGIIGAAWLLGEMIWRLAFFFEAKAVASAMRNLYETAMERVLEKDIDFFNNTFAGSLTKNVGSYARNYERFYGTIAFNISPNLIPIIFASVVLSFYSPYLSLLLVGMLLFIFTAVTPLIKKRRRLVGLREQSSTYLTGHVADIIGNAHAVRSFAAEANELATHKENVDDFIGKAKRSWDYQTRVVDMVIAPLYVLTNVLGLSLVIYLGHKNGDITTESVLVTFGFFAAATKALFEFNQIYRDMETSLTEGAQFTEYLLENPKIVDATSTDLHVRDAHIDFENVHFAYTENADNSVFENLNLTIKPGERIGLIGRSGSGKTTITKLLLRFMDIDSGAISIDSQDISNITQASLRKSISYVPQEPALFHRSLADNIRYSNPNATMAEVVKAAKSAHADEFIKDLPNGYETLVGERGVKLSGGQRQRVAIARAMLKDAPILVLDEATSALDSESEVLIQDALWKLMEGKTAIVIAHRLSTIQKMDRIIVLEKGAIVEQGSHKELLKKNGQYAKLWAHQSGGFIEE